MKNAFAVILVVWAVGLVAWLLALKIKEKERSNKVVDGFGSLLSLVAQVVFYGTMIIGGLMTIRAVFDGSPEE